MAAVSIPWITVARDESSGAFLVKTRNRGKYSYIRLDVRGIWSTHYPLYSMSVFLLNKEDNAQIEQLDKRLRSLNRRQKKLFEDHLLNPSEEQIRAGKKHHRVHDPNNSFTPMDIDEPWYEISRGRVFAEIFKLASLALSGTLSSPSKDFDAAVEEEAKLEAAIRADLEARKALEQPQQ